jgi:hypothetical protein
MNALALTRQPPTAVLRPRYASDLSSSSIPLADTARVRDDAPILVNGRCRASLLRLDSGTGTVVKIGRPTPLDQEGE